MIEAQGLSKDYGTTVAVSDLSFQAKPGEILGFLGPNGAGKTTTLRMIAGALGPTAGRIIIAGYDLVEQPMLARRSLGYMPEAAPLYPELQVAEYLRFRAALKGVARRQQQAKVEHAMRRTQVDDVAHVAIAHLSKGYRQRVALADALVANPPVCILDEPTAGLDPNQIRETRQLIRELGGEHTVIVSSHILSEIEELCDRVLVIHKGREVAAGSISELRSGGAAATLLLVVRDPLHRAVDLCSAFPAVTRVTSTADPLEPDVISLTVHCPAGSNLAMLCEELVKSLVQVGVGVLAAQARSARLEDIFAQLTQPTPNNAAFTAADEAAAP